MNTLEPTGLEAAIDAYLACRPKSTTACQDFGMQQRERISQQVTSAIRAYLSALPAAPMPGVKATEEQIDAAIREWMSDDDRSADGFRRRMRAALSALDVPAHPEGVKAAMIEKMRDDPFIDDAHLLGTTQQDKRMEHYAGAALSTLSHPEPVAQEAVASVKPLDRCVEGENAIARFLAQEEGR